MEEVAAIVFEELASVSVVVPTAVELASLAVAEVETSAEVVFGVFGVGERVEKVEYCRGYREESR